MSARKVLTTTFFLTIGLISPGIILGQTLDQVAYNVEIEDSSAQIGHIVSFKDSKFALSQQEYDPSMYGVIVEDPAVTFNRPNSLTKPVLTSGQALVRVSKKGGDIKVGDLITTSKDKGIGQKSTRSGHVLGKALSGFPNSEENGETALIPVLVFINYTQVSAQAEELTAAGLNEVAKKVSSALVTGNLPDLLKYIFALLLGLISFLVGLAHFVRSNSTAVEAIARNPMAKRDIQRQLVVGTGGILVVCGIGLAISIFILFFL